MPDRQISSFDVGRFAPTVGMPLKVAVTVLLFAHLPHLADRDFAVSHCELVGEERR
jgi:hypothetical protein